MPFRFALLALLALPVFATDSIAPGSLTCHILSPESVKGVTNEIAPM